VGDSGADSSHLALVDVNRSDVLGASSSDWWTADVFITEKQSLTVDNIELDGAQAFVHLTATAGALVHDELTFNHVDVALNNEGLDWGSVAHNTAVGAVQFDGIDLHAMGITAAAQLGFNITRGAGFTASGVLQEVDISLNEGADPYLNSGSSLTLHLTNVTLDSSLSLVFDSVNDDGIWDALSRYMLHVAPLT
jgi:hypothetical protein